MITPGPWEALAWLTDAAEKREAGVQKDLAHLRRSAESADAEKERRFATIGGMPLCHAQALASLVPEMIDALREAKLQLEYLNEKQERGTTNASLVRIDAILSKIGEQK